MSRWPALAMALGLAACASGAAAPVAGVFEGTGRACSGSLRMTARTLTWEAAFIRCGPVAYRTLPERLTYFPLAYHARRHHDAIQAMKVREKASAAYQYHPKEVAAHQG